MRALVRCCGAARRSRVWGVQHVEALLCGRAARAITTAGPALIGCPDTGGHPAMERQELGERSGSFAKAVVIRGAGRIVFVSGCVGDDGHGGVVGKGDVEEQSRQAFAHMAALLAEAGGSLANVVKLTCFIVPMADYRAYAKVRQELFAPNFPASSTVGVNALASPDYLIEIEAVAALP